MSQRAEAGNRRSLCEAHAAIRGQLNTIKLRENDAAALITAISGRVKSSRLRRSFTALKQRFVFWIQITTFTRRIQHDWSLKLRANIEISAFQPESDENNRGVGSVTFSKRGFAFTMRFHDAHKFMRTAASGKES